MLCAIRKRLVKRQIQVFVGLNLVNLTCTIRSLEWNTLTKYLSLTKCVSNKSTHNKCSVFFLLCKEDYLQPQFRWRESEEQPSWFPATSSRSTCRRPRRSRSSRPEDRERNKPEFRRNEFSICCNLQWKSVKTFS